MTKWRPISSIALPRERPGKGLPRSRAEGFTLVELTVALLAGLIVAMGIVALSREATNTFHEEARSSAAEAALRTAVDRLRADLARAGFMSTGNIVAAPKIAHAPGAANVPAAAPVQVKQLASILLTQGGSVKNGIALSAQQPIAVTPDLIQISGNMSSADQFDVASINTTIQPNCTRLYLIPNSPALFRVIGSAPYGATAGSDLRNIFFPSSLSASTYPFIVRLVDTNQCAQYLQTCTTGPVAGLDGTGLPFLDIDQTTPVITASVAATSCGVTGFGEGSTVNPVETVQWEITTQAGVDPEPAAYAGLGGTAAAATKYDLMRSYVSANGTIVPDTSEIIAEYAVDFSFAFSVDMGTAQTPSMVTYPFDDPMDNVPWAVLPLVATTGPQRIRSVRARVVTRAALPDRALNIPVAPTNYNGEEFAYRYCVSPSGCAAVNTAGVLQWARTRTITTEVALPNQAGNFY